MIRVGLIGCGFIGTVHSFALRQLRDAALIDAAVVATFDAEPERAAAIAAHHDARACPDLDAPVFRAVADAVADGRYGRPMATILRDDQYFPVQGMYGSEWRSDVERAGGGTLIEHSIHDVDVLRWVLGDPTEVAARTASVFGHAGIDDTTTLTLSYGEGSTATIVSVWHQILTRGSTRRLEVFCERALLWTDDDYLGPLHVETSDGSEVIEAPPPSWLECFDLPAVLAKPLGQYAEPAKFFLDALAADGPAARGWPTAAEALAAHRLVDLAYLSARAGGGPVPVA